MLYMYVILAGILLLGIVLFIIALKVIRIILKAMLMAVSVIMIVLVVFSFVVISDIREIKDHLDTDSSILLVEVNQTYVAGRLYLPGGDFEELPEDELIRYNNMTKDEIVEGYYKILIFSPKEMESEEQMGMLEKPIAVIKAYKDGEVEIYPELRTTKMIKKMPTGIIERILVKKS